MFPGFAYEPKYRPGTFRAYDANRKFMGILHITSGYPLTVRWAGQSKVIAMTEAELDRLTLERK